MMRFSKVLLCSFAAVAVVGAGCGSGGPDVVSVQPLPMSDAPDSLAFEEGPDTSPESGSTADPAAEPSEPATEPTPQPPAEPTAEPAVPAPPTPEPDFTIDLSGSQPAPAGASYQIDSQAAVSIDAAAVSAVHRPLAGVLDVSATGAAGELDVRIALAAGTPAEGLYTGVSSQFFDLLLSGGQREPVFTITGSAWFCPAGAVLEGTVDITHLSWTAGGEVDRLALSFDATCNPGTAAAVTISGTMSTNSV